MFQPFLYRKLFVVCQLATLESLSESESLFESRQADHDGAEGCFELAIRCPPSAMFFPGQLPPVAEGERSAGSYVE